MDWEDPISKNREWIEANGAGGGGNQGIEFRQAARLPLT
jgi:hypothetical protein